jgi:hypothetical protein
VSSSTASADAVLGWGLVLLGWASFRACAPGCWYLSGFRRFVTRHCRAAQSLRPHSKQLTECRIRPAY